MCLSPVTVCPEAHTFFTYVFNVKLIVASGHEVRSVPWKANMYGLDERNAVDLSK